MRKLLLLSMLTFLPIVGMNAQCVMSADDVTFSSGEQAEFYINLDVDDQYYKDTQFEIQFPEGFYIPTWTYNGETYLSVEGNETVMGSFGRVTKQGRQVGMSTNTEDLGNGLYRIVTVSISLNNYINDLTDLYFLMGLIEADENVESGTYPVTVKNIKISSNQEINGSYETKEHFVEPFTFNIIYTKPAKTHDLTVTTEGMATLYLDFPVAIPDNILGVYYVSGMVGSTLTMYEVNDNIPANTGVIVMANQGTYTFTESSSTVAAITDNLLKGVTASTPVSDLGGTIYTLGRGKNSGWLGFHKYTGSTLGANKAYLTKDTNVNSFNLQFPDGSTFINSLSIDGAKEVYDLQGRKVENPTAGGVYIINGVKTILR
ncbi:MAG: hypothetical protein IKH26_04965 [Bacteroidaceae bacterium]|nr:hypothetical protein [Bacteroidaceae bacterium]